MDYDEKAREIVRRYTIAGENQSCVLFQDIATALQAAAEEARAEERENGAKTFWRAFADFLDLHHTQRTYSWHDLADACEKGFAAIRERG